MAAQRPLPFNPSMALVLAVVTFLVVHSTLAFAASDLPLDPGFGDEMEFVMDSETNRRMLAAAWYISYGALWRNVVPCSRRGVSYYNCHSGTQTNPYTRGCSRITRCRG